MKKYKYFLKGKEDKTTLVGPYVFANSVKIPVKSEQDYKDVIIRTPRKELPVITKELPIDEVEIDGKVERVQGKSYVIVEGGTEPFNIVDKNPLVIPNTTVQFNIPPKAMLRERGVIVNYTLTTPAVKSQRAIAAAFAKLGLSISAFIENYPMKYRLEYHYVFDKKTGYYMLRPVFALYDITRTELETILNEELEPRRTIVINIYNNWAYDVVIKDRNGNTQYLIGTHYEINYVRKLIVEALYNAERLIAKSYERFPW